MSEGSGPDPGEGLEDSASDEAFEAELRAEVQADLADRLAEADEGQPSAGPGDEELADPWDQGDDPEGQGPVVMRPFPGMGGHNAIVGGGNLIAAFQEEVDPSAGYLVEELPGETLLVIEGAGPTGGRSLGLALAVALCFAPCIAMGLGVDHHVPPEYGRYVVLTVLGSTLVGLGLGAALINRALYDPGRVVCTSEGLGIQSGSVASWLPWEEVRAYTHDGEVISLESKQGAFSFTATPEEAAEFVDLLDHRGVHRGALSTLPPQGTEGV